MAERLTLENLVPQMREALPDCPVDSADVEERLSYLVFNDLLRYTRSLLEGGGNEPRLQRIFAFLEKAAASKDAEVVAVIRDALYDLAVHQPAEAEEYMGPATRVLYEKVLETLYGRPSPLTQLRRLMCRIWR